jgi:hypothetical protein
MRAPEICADPALRPEEYEVLVRLATDLRMQTVWDAVARHGEGQESEVIRYAFIRASQTLTHRPPYPRRRKDFEARIREDAENQPVAQSSNLESTAGFASLLVEDMQRTEVAAKAFLPPSVEHALLFDWAQYIANVYSEMSARQKEWALPRIGKKAAADAPQRAFSRAISNDFRKLFRQPHDDAAAALTAVVFNLPDGPGSTTIRGRRRSADRAAHSRKKSK